MSRSKKEKARADELSRRKRLIDSSKEVIFQRGTGPRTEGFAEAFRHLQRRYASGDDRTYVIVMSAFLDECARQVLEEICVTPQAAEKLLNPMNGALGAAGARLDAMDAFGLLRSELAAFLRKINHIRNKFAHHFDVESLEDFADLCNDLEPPNSWYKSSSQKIEPTAARELFERAVAWGADILAKSLQYAWKSEAPRIDILAMNADGRRLVHERHLHEIKRTFELDPRALNEPYLAVAEPVQSDAPHPRSAPAPPGAEDSRS